MKDVPSIDTLPPCLRPSVELHRRLLETHDIAFPNGQADVDADTKAIYRCFDGRLSMRECELFVRWGKPLLCSSKEASQDDIWSMFTYRLAAHFQSPLLHAYAFAAHWVLTKSLPLEARLSPPVLITGGNGSVLEQAVVVSGTPLLGENSPQHAYLEGRLGKAGRQWRFKQSSLSQVRGRTFDAVEVELLDGRTQVFHFDITASFGGCSHGLAA